MDRFVMGQSLDSGHVLMSPNMNFFVRINSDGNLIVNHTPIFFTSNVIWASATSSGYGPFSLYLQLDNNLVLLDRFETVLWQSDTDNTGTYDQYVVIRDDGNFVLADGDGSAIWETGPYVP